jgi:hypothetical protein
MTTRQIRQVTAHLPGGVWIIARTMRVPLVRRSPLTFGRLGKRVPNERSGDWVRALIREFATVAT